MLLTNSFEAVASGGLKVRNPLPERVVRQTVLRFGYTGMFEITDMYFKELCVLLCTTFYAW